MAGWHSFGWLRMSSWDSRTTTYRPSHGVKDEEESHGLLSPEYTASSVSQAGKDERLGLSSRLLVTVGVMAAVALVGLVSVLALLSLGHADVLREDGGLEATWNGSSRNGRPTFFYFDFDNADMPFNASLDGCPLPIALTDDANAADVFIRNVYNEDRMQDNDHRDSRWQPRVLFDLEVQPLRIVNKTHLNDDPSAPPFYQMRWTYEFDADLTYSYLAVNQFKDLRAAPLPFSQKLQVPVAADFRSHCDTAPRRELIVQELHRLLPGRIYSYGSCDNNRHEYQDVPELDPARTGRGVGHGRAQSSRCCASKSSTSALSRPKRWTT
jgi:hypothetical protein